jgi:hypothetical protein
MKKNLILNLQLIRPKHCSEVHRIHLDVWPVNKFELIFNTNINKKRDLNTIYEIEIIIT